MTDMKGRGVGPAWVVAATLAGVAVVFAVPPIPQDPAYHHFADRRLWLGVPHFGDVVSNLGFVLVGALGLGFVLGRGSRTAFADAAERWPYAVFFAGVALTGIGSGYYHWAPDNARLTWDRLPMTLGFLGLFAAVVAERVGVAPALRLLPPLLGLGLASVLYWRISEAAGAGDLRPYGVVQFGPLVGIPLLATLFPNRYTRAGDLLLVAVVYLGAKAFELLDATIFGWGRIVSGHTLKHLAAAGAAWLVLRMLARRRVRAP